MRLGRGWRAPRRARCGWLRSAIARRRSCACGRLTSRWQMQRCASEATLQDYKIFQLVQLAVRCMTHEHTHANSARVRVCEKGRESQRYKRSSILNPSAESSTNVLPSAKSCWQRANQPARATAKQILTVGIQFQTVQSSRRNSLSPLPMDTKEHFREPEGESPCAPAIARVSATQLCTNTSRHTLGCRRRFSLTPRTRGAYVGGGARTPRCGGQGVAAGGGRACSPGAHVLGKTKALF